jgi:hypothetical protein
MWRLLLEKRTENEGPKPIKKEKENRNMVPVKPIRWYGLGPYES